MAYSIKQYGPTGHEAAFVLGEITSWDSGTETVELGFVPSKVVVYAQIDDTSEILVVTWLNYDSFKGLSVAGSDDGTSDMGATWVPGGSDVVTAFEGDADTGAGFTLAAAAGAGYDHIYFEAWR